MAGGDTFLCLQCISSHPKQDAEDQRVREAVLDSVLIFLGVEPNLCLETTYLLSPLIFWP